MPGLLADVNVQGHLPYLRRLLEGLGLLDLITGLGLTPATFPDLGLARDLDDRALWHYCQANNWMLFTDNRNQEGEKATSPGPRYPHPHAPHRQIIRSQAAHS